MRLLLLNTISGVLALLHRSQDLDAPLTRMLDYWTATVSHPNHPRELLGLTNYEYTNFVSAVTADGQWLITSERIRRDKNLKTKVRP